MPRTQVGPLLRDWRQRRRVSQMDLALDVGVSTRHLSFVETGKSKPSPELVLALARGLEVPLRERNALLLAAGYAPRYTQHSLDESPMLRIRASLQRMLDAHDPYPGVVIDRQWNIVLANRAANALIAGLPPALLTPPPNVYRLCLHPDGLAGRTLNFPDWAAYLLGQLRHTMLMTNDSALLALEAEVRAYPNVAALGEHDSTGDDPPLLVPIRLRAGDRELAMFTTLTTFGTPGDITLDELAVELFFPEDDATDEVLRGAG